MARTKLLEGPHAREENEEEGSDAKPCEDERPVAERRQGRVAPESGRSADRGGARRPARHA
jgi:hypothetical protein